MQTLMLMAAAIQWNKVGMVLGIVAGLAIVFSILILIVTKVCNIHEDEKVTAILEHLAGANCGGCGCSGCAGFAQALASGKACLGDCNVTSKEEKAIIAQIAGLPLDDSEPTVAVVQCHGGANAVDKFEYCGNSGCVQMKALMGGSKLCSTACLGGGTCAAACPIGAIRVKDGIASVDMSICTSCGACIQKCPQSLITRIPVSAKVYVACSNKCRGKDVMNACKVGCIGCGLCAKSCPQGAITMVDNLPVIDYKKCDGCKTCVAKCPRKCILEHTAPALPSKKSPKQLPAAKE